MPPSDEAFEALWAAVRVTGELAYAVSNRVLAVEARVAALEQTFSPALRQEFENLGLRVAREPKPDVDRVRAIAEELQRRNTGLAARNVRLRVENTKLHAALSTPRFSQ